MAVLQQRDAPLSIDQLVVRLIDLAKQRHQALTRGPPLLTDLAQSQLQALWIAQALKQATLRFGRSEGLIDGPQPRVGGLERALQLVAPASHASELVIDLVGSMLAGA